MEFKSVDETARQGAFNFMKSSVATLANTASSEDELRRRCWIYFEKYYISTDNLKKLRRKGAKQKYQEGFYKQLDEIIKNFKEEKNVR